MITQFYTDWKIQSALIPYKEIDLFRLFALLLSRYQPTVFSDGMHGNVAQVEFSSSFFSGEKYPCEISDLLIVVYSTKNNQYRATFLQAKRRKHYYCRSIIPRFSFTGDLNQYDLLSNRPIIKGLGSFNPDPKILSSAILDSIGSYGVFYRSRSFPYVEFYYSIASHIIPRNISRKTAMYIPSAYNNYYCTKGIYSDLICAERIDTFAHNLIAMRIGSPVKIYSTENTIIRNIIQSHSTRNSDVRDFVQRNLDISDNVPMELPGVPNLLLIETEEN